MKQLELDFDEWKPLYGFEGIAEINLNGNVRTIDRYVRNSKKGSVRFVKGGNLKIQTVDGYYYVHIYKNNILTNVYLHKALYSTFVEPVPEGYDVHHINHNKKDNRLENLQMVTQKEHNEMHKNDRLKASSEKCSKPVLQFTLDGQFVAEYPSVREAEKKTGIYHSCISNACVNREWIDKNGKKHRFLTAGGSIWKYKEVA